MREAVRQAAIELLEYCRREDWSGWDPFDALNSRLLRALPLCRSRVFRLAVTQALKRLPINLRPLLLVPKGENPKACALFCSSLIRLHRAGVIDEESLIRARVQRLLELRSPDRAQHCWGYNFDWQSRGFLLPRFTPNIICTSFAGNALLDAHEHFGDESLLDAAASAGDFLREGLNLTEDEDSVCFSYTPLDRGQVHNANLLGAALLARLYAATGRREFRDLAGRATRFSLKRQRADGAWPYGEHETQRWVDNFHTGYNLVALEALRRVLVDEAVEQAIESGLEYYVQHFFTADGVPKYFDDRLWPIDVHCAAQSIVTLCQFASRRIGASALADKVCAWTLANMRDRGGWFYYRKTRLSENRIRYMRWSQAWMLYALAVYLSHSP